MSSRIVQRSVAAGVQAPLKITPTEDVHQTLLQVELLDEEQHLTSAACGSLLRALGGPEGDLPITSLSLSKQAETPADADAWNVTATLLVATH